MRTPPTPGAPYRSAVFLLLLLIGAAGCTAAPVRAETVHLPMYLDMPLLRSLVVERAYTEPVERAKVLEMTQGCNEVWLSDPFLDEDREMVRFQTRVQITWGTPIGGRCIAPLRWEGKVVLWQEPQITPQWQLRFVTRDSALLDSADRPVRIIDVLWDLIKDHVHGYLGAITIDLAPPVDNLRGILLPQFTRDRRNAAVRFLESMRPEQPVLDKGRLRIDILGEAPDPLPVDEEDPEASPESLARVMELWETWDALLIHLIGQLSGKPLSPEDRYLLMDTTLSMRYELNEALAGGRLTNSLVRGQFIRSWNALRPLFRNHLTAAPGESLLGYLSFFTAIDALAVLDRLGPSVGLEISRDGLHRLARLLDDGAVASLLAPGAVNPGLREVFGLGEPMQIPPDEDEPPVLEERIPPADSLDGGREEEPAPQPGQGTPHSWRPSGLPDVWRWLPGAPAEAWAGTVPSLVELRRWAAEVTPAETLLPRVRALLHKTGKARAGEIQVAAADDRWFDRMLLATAWQESCFRQFTVVEDKLTYLLSYNQTSVGLMQVNEKVWRGIYDQQELRWNVRYNCMAGTEILVLYLNRYLAGQKAPVQLSSRKGQEYLAVWLYALYNGGPGQLKKFPARHAGGSLYRSETLFLAKYGDSQGRDWAEKVTCLPRG